uniref:Rpn family recombination-promoting nuclease/putative transposase n=2 Tax=Citrobacter rodentium TaxID=67825 RepID=UPI0005B4D834
AWQSMFNEPEMAKTLYSNEFPLVDLTDIPDNQILQHQRIAMLELLQKHIRQRDLSELLDQLITLLSQKCLSDSQLNVLINYMLKAGNTADPGALIRQLARSAPQYKDQLMTIAEWLEEKGRTEGIELGMVEGRQAEARAIARKMLEEGIDTAAISRFTGLSADELTALSK